MSSMPIDTGELREWQTALDAVIEFEGSDYAKNLLNRLLDHAKKSSLGVSSGVNTPYRNTIETQAQKKAPDDGQIMTELTNMMRWNAIMMVMRAGKKTSELGGHIASYASIATLYEVGFNYFFHAETEDHGGDLVYFRGIRHPGYMLAPLWPGVYLSKT